jgi:hypothetical protein
LTVSTLRTPYRLHCLAFEHSELVRSFVLMIEHYRQRSASEVKRNEFW